MLGSAYRNKSMEGWREGLVWKGVAAEPDDLRLISSTHMIEGRTDSHRLCSGLHVYIVEYINRQINKKCFEHESK